MKILYPLILFLLVSYPLASALSTSYYFAGSTMVASKETGTLDYVYLDRWHSPTNSDFLPFGQVISKDHRFGFSGKEQDKSSLHYFSARYLDSDSGRFTSADPVKTEPTYQYVRNNPVNLFDPTGTESWEMNHNNMFDPPGWVEENVPDQVFSSLQYEVGESGASLTLYRIAQTTYGFTNTEGESYWDKGNGPQLYGLNPGVPLSDFDMRRLAGEVSYGQEALHQLPATVLGVLAAIGVYSPKTPKTPYVQRVYGRSASSNPASSLSGHNLRETYNQGQSIFQQQGMWMLRGQQYTARLYPHHPVRITRSAAQTMFESEISVESVKAALLKTPVRSTSKLFPHAYEYRGSDVIVRVSDHGDSFFGRSWHGRDLYGELRPHVVDVAKLPP